MFQNPFTLGCLNNETPDKKCFVFLLIEKEGKGPFSFFQQML